MIKTLGIILGIDSCFEVVGAAVTARIEKPAKSLDHRLLTSAEFSAPLRSLGRHVLAGVAEPQEVFTRAD